jgi:putative heme-binding domain-containing protein
MRSSIVIAPLLFGLFPLWLALGQPVAGAEKPRVVLAWPAGPLEVRVVFDRPVDPSRLGVIAGGRVQFRSESASGAEESGATLTASLRIAAARVEHKGRVLVLATDPHPMPAQYQVRLGEPFAQEGAVSYDLSGFEASWDNGALDAKPAWTGWLPGRPISHVLSSDSPSAEHRRLAQLITRPGRLNLRSLILLPQGRTMVQIKGNAEFEVALAGEEAKSSPGAKGTHRASVSVESTGEFLDLLVRLKTGPELGGRVSSLLDVAYSANGDPADRLRTIVPLLPWVPTPSRPSAPGEPPPFALSGGDRARGEAVFFSEEAKCSNCHKHRGKGGEVGPDLTSLTGKAPGLVYRDIVEPSAAINPEFRPYTVAVKDGRVLSGIVRAEGADAIRVVDTEAKTTVLSKLEIEELRPSNTSIMPVGLIGALGEGKLRDLLAFLTSDANR